MPPYIGRDDFHIERRERGCGTQRFVHPRLRGSMELPMIQAGENRYPIIHSYPTSTLYGSLLYALRATLDAVTCATTNERQSGRELALFGRGAAAGAAAGAA